MHPESVKARVVRMAMVRFDSQLHDPVLSPNIPVLHIKVLITGSFISFRVLISTKFDRLLVVLVVQALKNAIELNLLDQMYRIQLTQTVNPLGADSIFPLDNDLGICSIVNPFT